MWLHHGSNNRLLEADRGKVVGCGKKISSEKIHFSFYIHCGCVPYLPLNKGRL